jgi:hypothetical protein
LVAFEFAATRRNESGVKWNRYLIKLTYISGDAIQLKLSICEGNCSARQVAYVVSSRMAEVSKK